MKLLKSQDKKYFNVVPPHLTKSKLVTHTNLSMVQNKYYVKPNDIDSLPKDNDDTDIKYYYLWIKDLSRLLSSQLSQNTRKN